MRAIFKSFYVFSVITAVLCIFPAVNLNAEANVKFPDKLYDVTKFGAAGANVSDDTTAFQKAIQACAAGGGGTVLVPAGTYTLGPLYFTSNIRLELRKGALLYASKEEALFLKTEQNKKWGSGNYVAFINVNGESNIAVVGEGTIDGQGAIWWERFQKERAAGKDLGTNRPRLVYMTNVSNILFDGVTFANSPSFHIVLRSAADVDIKNVTINSPVDAPNTDGIDPINCRNIRIMGCTISCGDDHIAIKADKFDAKHPFAATANILITGCTFLEGRGLSIGSESLGGVKNIVAENNVFKGSMYGIRIKSPRSTGGIVTDVIYRDSKMENVTTAFVFSGYYTSTPKDQDAVNKILASGGFILGNQIYPADDDPLQNYYETKTPYFHDITVSNFECTGDITNAGFVIGLPEKPFENIVFENVKILAKKGMLIRNATVVNKGLEIKANEGGPFILQKDGVVK